MKRSDTLKPEDFHSTPMGEALEDLARRMEDEGLPPMTFNVVGGFALMVHGVRPKDGVTDIDYVGRPLPKRFHQISDEVGLAHRMGRGWINNDTMLSGSTMADFEFSTGKLHFREAFSVGRIRINVLDEEDLLRMKLIAVDTSMSGVSSGGEFTRKKDLPDVKALMDKQGVPSDELVARYREYIRASTQRIIQAYEEGGEDAVDRITDRIAQAYNDALREKRARMSRSKPAAEEEHQVNPYLAKFLQAAQKRADAEKETPWD